MFFCDIHILFFQCNFAMKECHKKRYKASLACIFNGGVERVRTSAPLSRPNCLANNPLHHLGTTPFCFGGEGGIRTHGKLFTYANFQDWCLKPTRPPLHIISITPFTVFILTYLWSACQ